MNVRFPEGAPKAFIHTYGCQGNLADSERIKGMLVEMGYELCENVEDADLIIVLDDGKINGIGNHDQLVSSNEIYREIYESQTKGGKME